MTAHNDAPTVAAQQCGLPEGLDAVDMDMIRRGDMLGPDLGERAASLIQSLTARIAELEAAIRGLLDCPDIADNDYKDEETHAAERAARSLLNRERKG